MRFTLGRVVHFYYVFVICSLIALFAYGASHYWSNGVLNIEYVSNLYDGTSKVRAVKERNDIDELKKFVDGDRLKDANKIYSRLEQDIHDLKSIRPIGEKSTLDSNKEKIKASLNSLQTSPELTTILNTISGKVTNFENFVTEKKWPTLTKMATNLRIKTSPGKLMLGGLYNFEKTQMLAQTINNDIEAMTNFTESTTLSSDIKQAILNRIKVIKNDVSLLDGYVEDHKKFNRYFKDFYNDYQAWFKLVEPEIALKKIQFEKSSQTILYSLIAIFLGLALALAGGVMVYNYSAHKGAEAIENIVLETIKDDLLPVEAKNLDSFTHKFSSEFEKYRDYVHKRMSFGSIFQEAIPFPAILLDSNLNLIWGNAHFYDQWKLKDLNDDLGDSLSWDFLQRFTDLGDNSVVLTALRMNTAGTYKIRVKTDGVGTAIPYQMHVSVIDYSAQKRVMVIFYPMSEIENSLTTQRDSIVKPMLTLIDSHMNEGLTQEMQLELKQKLEQVNAGSLYSMFNSHVKRNEILNDDMLQEIERLENELSEQTKILSEVRSSIVSSFENQKTTVAKYNQFKTTVSSILESRDHLEEQFKFAMSSSREFYKDQSKIMAAAEKAEKMVEDYTKTMRTVSTLKTDFKELKTNIEDYKSRITQNLDQILIFQNQSGSDTKLDQVFGKIKLELKGFEKVIGDFNEVVTQLDVTATKLDMMAESREKIDLEAAKIKLENLKNNLENSQFAVSKISQNSHQRDEEMINVLKTLIANLKLEMKRIDMMCSVTGLTKDHLKAITQDQSV